MDITAACMFDVWAHYSLHYQGSSRFAIQQTRSTNFAVIKSWLTRAYKTDPPPTGTVLICQFVKLVQYQCSRLSFAQPRTSGSHISYRWSGSWSIWPHTLLKCIMYRLDRQCQKVQASGAHTMHTAHMPPWPWISISKHAVNYKLLGKNRWPF